MHILENEHLRIQVSSHGAELQSIYHKHNEREYLWQGDSGSWNRKSPIMFPIVGKLANNTYYVKGREYHLTQHGFARDMEFELVEKTSEKLKFVLKANEKTMAIYPYEFKLSVSYKLIDNRISVKYKVYNNSVQLMYFAIGAQPGFNLDLSEHTLSDYYLDFYEPKTLVTKVMDPEVKLLLKEEKVLVKDQSTLTLAADLFKNDALMIPDVKKVALKNTFNDQEVILNLPDFPLLGLWMKDANSPFIALEPLSGVPDYVGRPRELVDKDYIQSLIPDSKFSATYSIEIK